MATNPSAFPTNDNWNPDGWQPEPGMTLRDWFAGQALVGFMSRLSKESFASSVDADDWSFEAGDAYRVAEAMLDARLRILSSEVE